MISKTTSNYSLFTEKTTGAWSVVFLFLRRMPYMVDMFSYHKVNKV